MFAAAAKALALALDLASRYFAVNKIWIRKHERPVAESVSIISCLLSLVTLAPFLVQSIEQGDSFQVVNRLLSVAMIAIYFAIGIGLWVPGWSSTRGMWSALKKALRVEKSEWSDLLLKKWPGAAEAIADILRRTALLDRAISPSEAVILRSFAERFGLPDPMKHLDASEASFDPAGLRRSVEAYLALSPPSDQAGQLLDLLRVLIESDGEVTREERASLAEIGGLIADYLDGETRPVRVHEVLVVPQGDAQVSTARELLGDVHPIERCGGRVYVAGCYYHEEFAELVAGRYRARGLLSLVLSCAPEVAAPTRRASAGPGGGPSGA